jgi:hypothetical protein
MRLSAPAVVLSLLAAASGPLRAQGLLPSTPSDSVAAIVLAPDTARVPVSSAATPRDVRDVRDVGASLTGLRAGVHHQESARPNQPVLFARRAPENQARAMMIVGVAALIAGAIIGDTPGTIIMVGGTVVGLIGLYEYIQ